MVQLGQLILKDVNTYAITYFTWNISTLYFYFFFYIEKFVVVFFFVFYIFCMLTLIPFIKEIKGEYN